MSITVRLLQHTPHGNEERYAEVSNEPVVYAQGDIALTNSFSDYWQGGVHGCSCPMFRISTTPMLQHPM